MRWKTPWTLATAILAMLAGKAVGGLNDKLQTSAAATEDASQPVILELFTSEGCSSCPPADAFLKQLDDDADRTNHIEIIAIEEHVDYWDRLGWRDPFSSHDWTERQQQYARFSRDGGVYTPQFVADGRSDLSGSSTGQARRNIIQAAKAPHASIRVLTTKLSPKSAEFSVAIQNAPPEARSAELWLAVTERGLSSNVLRGENEGRNLAHAAVLRSLTQIKLGHADLSAPVETNATVKLDPSWKSENLHFVVFLQEPKTLRILGAAASILSR
jgi:hypothetical protein